MTNGEHFHRNSHSIVMPAQFDCVPYTADLNEMYMRWDPYAYQQWALIQSQQQLSYMNGLLASAFTRSRPLNYGEILSLSRSLYLAAFKRNAGRVSTNAKVVTFTRSAVRHAQNAHKARCISGKRFCQSYRSHCSACPRRTVRTPST